MERDIEEDLIVIECVIKNQIERHDIFTVAVLQRCHKLVTELKEYRALKERLNSMYGECDGFLEVVVEYLERHEGSVLGEFGKTVFLTQEEVESHGIERRGKMRVYISGAITGTNDYRGRFNAVEDRLTSEGMSVVNPAKINSNLPKDFIYAEYMEIDFLMIDLCDAIYMMDGWQKSRGATREYWYASGKEKIILFEGKRENHGEGNT